MVAEDGDGEDDSEHLVRVGVRVRVKIRVQVKARVKARVRASVRLKVRTSLKTPAMDSVRHEASCTTRSSKRSMRKAATPPREASLVGARVGG